jgi:hypothetical protein
MIMDVIYVPEVRSADTPANVGKEHIQTINWRAIREFWKNSDNLIILPYLQRK